MMQEKMSDFMPDSIQELPEDPDVAEIFVEEITQGGEFKTNIKPGLDELDENDGETVAIREKAEDRRNE